MSDGQLTPSQALAEGRLTAVLQRSPQLAAIVNSLQRLAVNQLVQARNAKAAMKLYRRFQLTEADAPELRQLCERNALAWHVAAGHLDMLEGRISRRWHNGWVDGWMDDLVGGAV